MNYKKLITLVLLLPCLVFSAAGSETVHVCYVEEGSSFLEDMTTASLGELCTVTDVTGEYRDKPRGYGFRLDLSGITGEEAMDALADAPWLALSLPEPQGEIVTLEMAGFSTIDQAREAGYTRFYLDTAGFWGLDVPWLPIDSREKLRDEAMTPGVLEYYVNPWYLYETYLAPGTAYEHWQGDYLGLCLEEEAAEPELVLLSEDQLVIFTAEATAPSALAAALNEIPFPCGPYRAETLENGDIRLTRNDAYTGTRGQDYPDAIICRPAP